MLILLISCTPDSPQAAQQPEQSAGGGCSISPQYMQESVCAQTKEGLQCVVAKEGFHFHKTRQTPALYGDSTRGIKQNGLTHFADDCVVVDF